MPLDHGSVFTRLRFHKCKCLEWAWAKALAKVVGFPNAQDTFSYISVVVITKISFLKGRGVPLCVHRSHVCQSACTWRSKHNLRCLQASSTFVFFCFVLRQGLLLSWNSSSREAGQPASTCQGSSMPSQNYDSEPPRPAFFIWIPELDSVPQACRASTLLSHLLSPCQDFYRNIFFNYKECQQVFSSCASDYSGAHIQTL